MILRTASRISFIASALVLVVCHLSRAQDGAKFLENPLTVKELASLVGVEKSGHRVEFSNARYVRLVAEIMVNGKTRTESITLKEPTKECSFDVTTQKNAPGADIIRIVFTLSRPDLSESRYIRDFRGSDVSSFSWNKLGEIITFRYALQTTVATNPKPVGTVKIVFQSSTEPFTDGDSGEKGKK
jgi:hypothetical protein